MRVSVLAELAALKTMPIAELKAKWLKLFNKPAPPYNRHFIEARLAYRIQELAYGGLDAVTVARLDALAESVAPAKRAKGRKVAKMPALVTGTQLVREYQGVTHRVTVRPDGFEFRGVTFKSLSAIARRITGTQWNGWAFFGLRSPAKGGATTSAKASATLAKAPTNDVRPSRSVPA